MIQKLKKDNKGFTLVELIVVIAILGVLMAVLVPQYIQYVEKSRIAVDESYIGEVAHSMEIAAAGNPIIYGQTVTVTLKAAQGTFSSAATSASPTTAESDAAAKMGTELISVFPTQTGLTTQTTVVYKSKEYTTGAHAAAVSLALNANGKVTVTGTLNTIGG